MKKLITLSMAVGFALAAHAQTDESIDELINWKEDTASIRTIANVVAEKSQIVQQGFNVIHLEDVWARRTFHNFAFNSATLAPKADVPVGLNVGGVMLMAPTFKSNLGLAYWMGHNYRLHPRPLANMVQFYADIVPFDIAFNHYAIENGTFIYDSNLKHSEYHHGRDADFFYMPWNLEKYEVMYGLSFGPSVTFAPFTRLENAPAMHYLKLNFYYHLGYRASALLMSGKEEADVNRDAADASLTSQEYRNYSTMKDITKFNWGHGLTNTFGLSLTWKGIGLGYEVRTGSLRYKPFSTGTFGNNKYKFGQADHRIYLSLRISNAKKTTQR